MLPKRAPLPRPPAGGLDAALEDAAARVLEQRRGKAARRAPPAAGAFAAKVIRAPKGATPAGKSLDALRRQWREVVGDKLAQMTEPEALTAGADRTLTLRVAGPAAPFVQHQIPLLIERCNLAGANVARIQIKQGALTRPKGNVRPLAAPLAADEERLLAAALAPVESDRLRAALLRIGRSVGRAR